MILEVGANKTFLHGGFGQEMTRNDSVNTKHSFVRKLTVVFFVLSISDDVSGNVQRAR